MFYSLCEMYYYMIVNTLGQKYSIIFNLDLFNGVNHTLDGFII